MKRRQFVLGVAIVLAPGAPALAQMAKRLGFIFTLAESDPQTVAYLEAMREGLAAQGWVEGQNLEIDYHFGAATLPLSQEAAALAVAAQPDVLLTVAGNPAGESRKLTSTIPIVFTLVTDPVQSGLVTNLARPDGNATGFTNIAITLPEKWLDYLRELSPSVRTVGFLAGQGSSVMRDLEPVFVASATRAGLIPVVMPTTTADQLRASLRVLRSRDNPGLVVSNDPLLLTQRDVLMAEVAALRMPSVWGHVLYRDGVPLTYGIDPFDLLRRGAEYAGRVLNGARPADLPVQAPTKYTLTLNPTVAGAAGLSLSSGLLQRADEIVE